MHEFALAEAVIAAALKTADRSKVESIAAIDIRIGELQKIDKETFEFALTEVLAATQPRLASTEIRIEVESARFGCRPCGRHFALDEENETHPEEHTEANHFIPELGLAFLRCPHCGSADFEVIAGQDVSIHSIEGA